MCRQNLRGEEGEGGRNAGEGEDDGRGWWQREQRERGQYSTNEVNTHPKPQHSAWKARIQMQSMSSVFGPSTRRKRLTRFMLLVAWRRPVLGS